VAARAKKYRAAAAAAAPAETLDLKAHRKRAAKAWSNRESWQTLYDDAYEFVIPHRRPATRIGKGQQRIERLYDATAMKSAFRSAGKLHQDLFPPDFFKLALGSVAKAAVQLGKYPKEQAAKEEKELEIVSAVAKAFFETGEFNTASSETTLDLLVGTAALFPIEGDDDDPVRFVCPPFDELAIDVDAYGAVSLISWKQMLTRRAIKTAFPKGDYPAQFEEKYKANPDEEIEIFQDFYREGKKWKFCGYLTDSEVPIAEDEYRTQPMAVARYHRVPGEPYGRGPILLALPTIKTLNKAVELTLKAAAIQMLGIWGYRPGGAFNPDTVRLAPGEFWPMQGTGGVLGPDVTRLDPAAGRVDVGNLVTAELRTQVQQMLNDDTPPSRGATPPSATEVMERMQRIAQNYLGAWGRVVQELVPPTVRRVLEILYRRKLINIDVIGIDKLLVKVDVLSPIAAAVKAAAHTRIIEFIELVSVVKGSPMAAELIVKVDDALRLIGSEQLPPSLMMTPDEQKDLEARVAKLAAALVAAQQQPAQAPAA
jgi:hypothetical protein